MRLLVTLDATERLSRVLVGSVLLLLTWGLGWTRVEALVTLALGVGTLASALVGRCPVKGLFDPDDPRDVS